MINSYVQRGSKQTHLLHVRCLVDAHVVFIGVTTCWDCLWLSLALVLFDGCCVHSVNVTMYGLAVIAIRPLSLLYCLMGAVCTV